MDEQQLKLEMLKRKLDQLRQKPYGSNTDEMVRVNREIQGIEGAPKPMVGAQVERVLPNQGQIERIDKVKAAQFQKGLQEGPDVMGNIEDQYKRIKGMFNK